MTRRIMALVGDTHADADKRFDEHNEVMSWIAWDAKGRGAQALLHSGDVYERTSNSLEREAVTRWVMSAAALMPVVVIAGNHDDPRDIEALGHLDTQHRVYAVTRPGPIMPVDFDGRRESYSKVAWVACLPWPQKAYLLAGAEQTSRAQADHDAVTALRNILRGYGDSFSQLSGTEPRIFLGHCMMRGSRVGVSQPPLVGADLELGLDDLALVGADIYALGHIHLGQEWEVTDPRWTAGVPAIYPGSPSRKNFGETEDKSYVLITFDDRTLVSWERIPTPCRKMVHLTGGHMVVDGFPALALNEPLPDELDNTEVRLRYEVTPEQRVSARIAAQRLASLIRDHGASNVVLEEVVKVEQRARAPEVAAATSNADRLRAHWASKRIVHEPSLEAELIGKLGDLETSLAETSTAPRLGAIRFKSLRIKGFGPFAHERHVQFDQLDGRLTAVTGANGAGKSTLLESLIGGVYRRCPTRGDLINLATARDARIEVELETGGHAYYIKQLVDAVSRKGEAVITRDEAPAVGSTKVTAVQDYIERTFPSLDLQLVSTFAAQKSRGFLDTKPSERKALLLQVRGVEHVQELAGLARIRATAESDDAAKLDARIAERTAEASRLATEQAALSTEEGYLVLDEVGLAAAQAKLKEAVNQNANRAASAAERARHLAQQRELSGKRTSHETQLAGVQQRREGWIAIQKRAPAIRAAAARMVELTAQREKLKRDQAFADTEAKKLADRQRRLSEARDAARALHRSSTAALAVKPAVDQALIQRPVRETELTAARDKVEQRRQALRELEGQRLLNADDRIEALRGALTTLRDGPPDRPPAIIADVAGGALERDDQAVARAAEVPKQIVEACGELGGAEREVRVIETDLAALNASCAQAPLLERAAADQATAQLDLNRLERELTETAAELLTAQTAAGQAGKSRLTAIDEEMTRLRADASAAPSLERAEAALDELNPQQAQLEQSIAALAAELSALGAAPDEQPEWPTGLLEDEVRWTEEVIKTRRASIAGKRERSAASETAVAMIERLSGQRDARLAQLSQWQRLALDLGKDGLQAALSDAALPELVALTNSLLHSAFGPRFTVDVRSQKGDSTGKRVLETLDVVVIDTGDAARGINGREALAETYSGGELAIIGEALSLALTVLACRSSDGTAPTLVRDEAGAALDPINGRAWIAMLRRAVEMVGADRLLFVSHSPEITALADSRIDLGSMEAAP
jgi:DNA repair exonuclease SbcCD ATPase subunit/DNA repair exonuclease SbcCD nuclease subunit